MGRLDPFAVFHFLIGRKRKHEARLFKDAQQKDVKNHTQAGTKQIQTHYKN